VTPRKVLVVEDSKLLHKMYDVMLQQFTLVHASDGREGLDRLAAEADIDLVLLDLNMPNMDGLAFLAAMKGDAAIRQVPVVIVSTEGRDEDTQRGLAAGAVAYIRKPFRKEEILEVIARVGAEP
jgi:two-component system chemotaxis response regulator CheY